MRHRNVGRGSSRAASTDRSSAENMQPTAGGRGQSDFAPVNAQHGGKGLWTLAIPPSSPDNDGGWRNSLDRPSEPGREQDGGDPFDRPGGSTLTGEPNGVAAPLREVISCLAVYSPDCPTGTVAMTRGSRMSPRCRSVMLSRCYTCNPCQVGSSMTLATRPSNNWARSS
jgi:hypothetical protein